MTGDPEARFADVAARISGHCALLLGWRPDEFWSATPAEITAIFAAIQDSRSKAGIDRDDINRLMEQDSG